MIDWRKRLLPTRGRPYEYCAPSAPRRLPDRLSKHERRTQSPGQLASVKACWALLLASIIFSRKSQLMAVAATKPQTRGLTIWSTATNASWSGRCFPVFEPSHLARLIRIFVLDLAQAHPQETTRNRLWSILRKARLIPPGRADLINSTVCGSNMFLAHSVSIASRTFSRTAASRGEDPEANDLCPSGRGIANRHNAVVSLEQHGELWLRSWPASPVILTRKRLIVSIQFLQ